MPEAAVTPAQSPELEQGTGRPDAGAFRWGQPGLELGFDVGADGVVRMTRLGPAEPDSAEPRPADPRPADGDADRPGVRSPGARPPAALPIVEAQITGFGRHWSGERSVQTVAGGRLAYRGHEQGREGGWLTLRIDLADPAAGLTAQAHFRSPEGVAVVRSWVRVANEGSERLVLESVTSLVTAGFTSALTEAADPLADFELFWADNEWLAEGRWRRRAARDLVVDLNHAMNNQDPRGCFFRASQGTWSTARYLAMGAVTARSTGRTLLWQVENPGSWRWEFGSRADAAYLALLGPTDRDHQWRQVLEPGDVFTTVPGAVALGVTPGEDGFAEAFGAMTRYRRALRRPHPDHAQLPVVFNDYMNTLSGDPTTERLLPLVEAAAKAGAEYFVIDAGWYDDDAGGWWDSVGEWEESASRFPGGLAEVTDRIKALGMTPGLWLEPEVVGLRSPVAERLPDEAFFRREGVRVVEHGRYHLDLRHPAAVEHLDRVVDRLVADYGVGYFKLDYNINPGPGTDTDGSAGAGLLGHQRAYLRWLDAVLDRHPGLTLENCGSGGMRTDYALLARMQLQSTSDQQDFRTYPPIAAAAPAAMAPEQAAVWAYPQADFSADEIAFTLCSALLGRVHLSGHLNRMDPDRFALVAQAVAVYKEIRADIARAVPFWPLGLPGWTDPWIAVGERTPGTTYLAVWRRDGSADADTVRGLAVPHLRGRDVDVRVLYPEDATSELRWDPDTGELAVGLPRVRTACILALDAPGAG
ncbi:MAG TPA: alpha-galactosidase [Actinocrinis sp.]|nr:alpha-galactosidase [Actinocrinis sp.]